MKQQKPQTLFKLWAFKKIDSAFSDIVIWHFSHPDGNIKVIFSVNYHAFICHMLLA